MRCSSSCARAPRKKKDPSEGARVLLASLLLSRSTSVQRRDARSFVLPLAPSHSAEDSRPAFASALSLVAVLGNSFGIGYGAGGR